MGRTWLQKIETFLIVTVISVLVWLYADVQTVKQHTNQHVQIKLVPFGDRELAIQPSIEQDIRISFKASNQQYQQFVNKNRALKQESRAFAIPIDAPPDGGPTRRPMNVADLLQQSELNDLRLDITSTDPIDLNVRVEPLERVQLPVEVQWEGTNVADDPVSDVKRATVIVPRSMVPRVRGSRLIADLAQSNLAGVQPGVAEQRQVALRLPEDLLNNADPFTLANINYQPQTVAVTFTVQSLNESYTIQRVPIDLRLSPALLRKFHIDVPDGELFLSDITVTGPSQEIDRIRSRKFQVAAYIRPNTEDIQNGERIFVPRLDLPPGVLVSSPLSPVSINAEPRN